MDNQRCRKYRVDLFHCDSDCSCVYAVIDLRFCTSIYVENVKNFEDCKGAETGATWNCRNDY